jgi:AraC family transcriptional regulator, transcriptional activator of pobA
MQKPKLQPLFLEDLTLSFGGFRIERFAYHRHSNQSDKISNHKHSHSQFLLYLRGRGIQTTDLGKQPVMRGSFLYFPPETIHGFIKSIESPPLSLVFDFKEKKPVCAKPLFRSLPPAILSEIERSLHRTIHSADLGHLQSPRIAAEILTLFAVLHDNLGQGNEPNPRIHPVTSKIRRRLTELPKAVGSPRELAKLIGEDLSSLNRKIRNESGLNLGTLLDERRLELCYGALKAKKLPIAQIAWNAGFQDPNYFSRWFRKKVGQTPLQWSNKANLD